MAASSQPVRAEQAGIESAQQALLARRFTMGVGRSIIVDLSRDATEIVVANPAVASAVVRSPRKIFVLATGAGQTTIFALDQQGRQIANIELTVGRDQGAGAFPEEHDQQAPNVNAQVLSRRHGPSDLRRIRHVDRARFPQGQPGNRRASVPLAEEFTLATAELAYLPDRRQAFENLGTRTGVDSIQQISTVLIQAEKYGTPPRNGVARRRAGKPRDAYDHGGKEGALAAAETDRADDPVFLPVLFAVIITPAVIQVMAIP